MHWSNPQNAQASEPQCKPWTSVNNSEPDQLTIPSECTTLLQGASNRGNHGSEGAHGKSPDCLGGTLRLHTPKRPVSPIPEERARVCIKVGSPLDGTCPGAQDLEIQKP